MITRACLLSVTAACRAVSFFPNAASFCEFQVSREFGASIDET